MMVISSECKRLNDEERAKFDGEFIELSDGITHYSTAGPKRGPVVIMVNGFSVPMYIWGNNYQQLADAGFHVIRYDLYGRGGSDRLSGRYDLDLYVRQITELISALVPKKKVHIIGICMGSIISASYAAENSNKVRSVTLIGPAGQPGALPSYSWLARIPFYGDCLMQFWGDYELITALSHHLQRYKEFPEYEENFFQQMQYRGLKAALLSTIRYMPVDDSIQIYRQLSETGLPVTLIWGDQDQLVPVRYLDSMLKIIPQAKGHVIKNSGHVCNYEDADKVNTILIEALKSHK